MDKEILENGLVNLFEKMIKDIESYKVDSSKSEYTSMLSFDDGWNSAIDEIIDYLRRGAKKDYEE